MQPPAPRSRLRTILRAGGPALLIALLASACMLPPEPKTEAGQDVFNLYLIVLALAAIVFVGVEGFILYAIFRYRRRPGDDALPAQHHGNTLVEIVWTLIPTVIVFILFGFSMGTLAEVEARSDEPGITVHVEGFQWQWQFSYEDGPVIPPGSVADPPVLAVPVGEPVRLILDSDDVIHAFYVPQFLLKRDMIPTGGTGEPNEIEFTVTEAGTYAGQCAEFCGTAHAEMTFLVQAMPRAEYDEYIAAIIAGEPPPTSGGDCDETIEITADNTQFDIDEFTVPADTEFCIAFENLEAVPHNVSILDGSERLFEGSFLNEPGSIVYNVPALAAGEYTFVCDAHVQAMSGTVRVTE